MGKQWLLSGILKLKLEPNKLSIRLYFSISIASDGVYPVFNYFGPSQTASFKLSFLSPILGLGVLLLHANIV